MSIIIFGSLKFMLIEPYDNNANANTSDNESIEIKGKRSLDRISLDRNCVFSLDRNFTNHLIEFFDTFHLIES